MQRPDLEKELDGGAFFLRWGGRAGCGLFFLVACSHLSYGNIPRERYGIYLEREIKRKAKFSLTNTLLDRAIVSSPRGNWIE